MSLTQADAPTIQASLSASYLKIQEIKSNLDLVKVKLEDVVKELYKILNDVRD